MPFDSRKDAVAPDSPKRVVVTDDQGQLLDGAVRGMVWSTASLTWIRGQQAVLSTDTLSVSSDITSMPSVNVGFLPTMNIGLTTHPNGLGSVTDGRQVVTTAGTRVQMGAQACKSIAITAETDNTGIIVVGGATVVASLATRQGLPISAGASVTFDVDNANRLYLDSTVSGDGVTWVAIS